LFFNNAIPKKTKTVWAIPQTAISHTDCVLWQLVIVNFFSFPKLNLFDNPQCFMTKVKKSIGHFLMCNFVGKNQAVLKTMTNKKT